MVGSNWFPTDTLMIRFRGSDVKGFLLDSRLFAVPYARTAATIPM